MLVEESGVLNGNYRGLKDVILSMKVLYKKLQEICEVSSVFFDVCFFLM